MYMCIGSQFPPICCKELGVGSGAKEAGNMIRKGSGKKGTKQ